MTDSNTDDDGLVADPGLPNGTPLLDAQFTITRRLSAGGFGITYLAEDNTLGRTIVIKECFPEELCMRDGHKIIVRNAAKAKLFQSIIGMFMHEARSLAKLRHPNIVGVHRAFEENGTAYMALDLIDGHDMLDILEEGVGALPPPARIEEILLQLLGAIEMIHKHDLLHRDISPDNVIIENTGTPVLIDFGAARAEASRKTRAVSSMIIVKDGYSPQEFYVSGSVQTPCSDLYALAATFYHIISGEAPANSQIRMAELVGKNPDPCVPLAGRFDGYDPAFLAAIDKAMQVVPRNRLQTAAEWREMITVGVPDAPNHEAKSITNAKLQPVSQDLERILTKIIEETNEDVSKAEPPAPKAAPRKVSAPPKEAKPDWLSEFNAESLRTEFKSTVDDEPEPEIIKAPTVKKRVLTRMISMDSSDDDTAPDWAARVIEKNEKAREQYKQAEIAEAVAKGTTSQRKLTSVLMAKDDPRLSGTNYEGSRLIEPLMKYLLTGIVLGLVTYFIYPMLS